MNYVSKRVNVTTAFFCHHPICSVPLLPSFLTLSLCPFCFQPQMPQGTNIQSKASLSLSLSPSMSVLAVSVSLKQKAKREREREINIIDSKWRISAKGASLPPAHPIYLSISFTLKGLLSNSISHISTIVLQIFFYFFIFILHSTYK